MTLKSESHKKMTLESMEKVVLQVLEESLYARQDDYVLMYLVCEKINPEILKKPLNIALYNHNELGLPNFDTITRARRKIQANRPDLKIEKTAKNRRKREQMYKKYAHS